MIIIMSSDHEKDDIHRVTEYFNQYSEIKTSVHEIRGTERMVAEIYVIGPTSLISSTEIEKIKGVERVVRVSDKYRIIGRHQGQFEAAGFTYNQIKFDQNQCHIFAGLCAVDTKEHVEEMMKALEKNGIQTTRMGVYKPRTSPYDFQGHGAGCLPYVFELAGTYHIKVIAMEVTHESHIEEIRHALDQSGHPTGVMLQVGTRNAQNFELLKAIGQQAQFPVLYKRGMGITLEESLNACEYIAEAGNRNIVFCLRGVKTNLGEPHRNLVDFAHVPTIKRMTRMPVCIDPSHSVGTRLIGPDNILDICHATAQGVIAGVNMVLVDFHPHPEKALCDGPQALYLEELRGFIEDVTLVRETYLKRKQLFLKDK
ncbi:MAG: 3-deoxy-7-phosphoheptulonate synthase [Chlamydiota bacterium]|nr:3-deoxy-7-phosphoheptulonate synthase [Chlamydiota bacterium]